VIQPHKSINKGFLLQARIEATHEMLNDS
jgi:hypothetical protein